MKLEQARQAQYTHFDKASCLNAWPPEVYGDSISSLPVVATVQVMPAVKVSDCWRLDGKSIAVTWLEDVA